MSNTNVKFALKFAAHKMEVVFNPAENAQWVTFGGNGKSWQSAQFCNAIGERINVKSHRYILGNEPGLYLSKTFAEVYDGLAHLDNFGYAVSDVVKTLLDKGEVSYRNEVLPHKIYGFGYDGMTAFAHMLNPRTYEEGEPDFRDHVRNAYDLVRNLEDLRKAEEKGINIRLIYTDRQQPRFDLMAEQWNLFLEEKYDELANNIQDHVLAGAEKKAFRTGERDAAKALEAGRVIGLTGINQDGELCDLNSVVGHSINFIAKDAKRGWLVLPLVVAVTAENVNAVASTLKRKGYRFQVTSEEVTEVAINSKERKARRQTATA